MVISVACSIFNVKAKRVWVHIKRFICSTLARDFVQVKNFGPLCIWVWHPWSKHSTFHLTFPKMKEKSHITEELRNHKKQQGPLLALSPQARAIRWILLMNLHYQLLLKGVPRSFFSTHCAAPSITPTGSPRHRLSNDAYGKPEVA